MQNLNKKILMIQNTQNKNTQNTQNKNIQNIQNIKNIGILTMVRLTLGPWVSIFAGFVYVFIHYSLLVAYIAEAGDIISDFMRVPKWIGEEKYE